MILKKYDLLCKEIRSIAIEAGQITLRYYNQDSAIHVDTKQDNSPVTVADREAENFITSALYDILPEVPVVGEEAASKGDLPDLKSAEYFWLVDPLDGTKEFINGGEDYTVNIALIHQYEPILGVVYAPVIGELYAGYGLGTAVKWIQKDNKEYSIAVRKPLQEGLTVVASRRHGDQARLDTFLQSYKVQELVKRGSSLKICILAEGQADMYPRFGPTCEWDTAAGDAVLRSAGGLVTDIEGNLLRYGGFDPKFLNPEFVASAFEWFNKK